MMDEKEISQHIKSEKLGGDIRYFETLDSTNSSAKALLKDGAQHGTLIVADEQTAGRGRVGRTWHSEKGKNLTFSVIVHPTIPAAKFGIISLMAGVAIAEAIKKTTQLSPQCKWPNDVYINGKKVAGILSEAIFTSGKPQAVVIGVGVNVNQTDFPPEIQKVATSLARVTGKPVDRLELLGSILVSIEQWFETLEAGDTAKIISAWRTMSYLLGKEITIDHFGRHIKCIAGDICEDGGMMVRGDGQDIKVIAGDITVHQ